MYFWGHLQSISMLSNDATMRQWYSLLFQVMVWFLKAPWLCVTLQLQLNQHGSCWWLGIYLVPGYLQASWRRRLVGTYNNFGGVMYSLRISLSCLAYVIHDIIFRLFLETKHPVVACNLEWKSRRSFTGSSPWFYRGCDIHNPWTAWLQGF